ncbi:MULTISPECIES: hybrid sensor histidine kinase/response regulator [Rhodanobacter]|uniref:hybrid sensor histidine kinase/response regulator n=1 Tax=Rhodanobacter TaxID=75309 RepID=UPI000484668D|nr:MULTISPECIES: PAS domain-containing hybrid sensor histidine kinase/response regulator [Rhodanobacter]UJJ51125.1 hybrid sensor histidine kinase/response regulator [Rhodanobacter denitrificans]UJJ60094.1 hybrid sensor histidine kinase/response regulator [Rhodanobacter denitrificans]UJM90338.1 hybrid sensor histidine kinase/response regulator [Rhodanobacter denitrificans]UJM93872.1 hybrid sensor histidine kinase/response regulator [Rhodanobacter denitrificans]UJM97402.1 hybrid sensor histidine
MIQGWMLLLVSLLYVGLLFVVAYAGDRRPLYPRQPRLRPIVYSLALAVYCSSWTFYGAVGTAARDGLAYLPIYLGPILLFVFGFGLLRRLVQTVRQRNITSIADFIGARFGKSHGLAALVAVIAVVAVVPYIALQFKAVAMSYSVLGGVRHGMVTAGGVDSALWCAVLLAVFAILFGTRSIDATEHHHGMMLAIALESLIKLLAFVALAGYALWQGPGLADTVQLPAAQLSHGLSPGFLAQTMLAFCAMFCLPRQFQIGMVECEDTDDLTRARWMVPLYLVIVSVAVLPIVAAGAHLPLVRDGAADAWVLTLPMAHGDRGMALLAFIGGFSAATGMVIVASVALSTMISNDLVMPALLRIRPLRLEQRSDLSQLVLGVRRVAIILLAVMAYAYYRAAANAENLAATGLLAFAAVAQFAPALIAALYWRGASRRGVIVGLAGGFAVWLYTLLLPALIRSDGWLQHGPFGWDWLRPQALFHLSGWDPVMHGTFWSLLTNVGCLVFVSLRLRPSLEERLHAAMFMDADPASRGGSGDWRGRVAVADLRTIAERIVGERSSVRAFEEYGQRRGKPLLAGEAADRALIQYTERLLASAVGAANARRILISALSGSGLDLAESMALLDEASQELRFNRELLSTTLENVSQGISVVDARMRLVAWNRRYLELFDYPDGMVHVGVPVAELIRWNAERGECGPGEVEAHVAKRIQYMRAGSAHLFQRVRPDGTVIEMRGRALPGGGYVTTYTDVTAYKHAEQALIEVNETLEQRVEQRTAELSEALVATAQARRAAETANISKTRFLAAASHDLLQPLNAARLFTSALRQHPGLDPEASGLAERIDASFRAAEDLLDALLDVSRLDAGSYHPEVGAFALAELFDSLTAQFAVVAERRGLRLRVVPTRLAVRSDPQLLRRILQNFLSNALRYTSKGSVLLGARRVGVDEVRIEVWDSGPGIAAEQRARIFDEFQRLEQPSPWGEKGLGLGLSICDRLAGILGHRLDLHSRVEHGSCFAVTVPRNEAVPVRRQRVQRSGTDKQLPLTVLCLDNDAAILDGMRALLSRWGVDCRIALDAAQARDELRRGTVDLILADYHLADDADGLQVLQQLRQTLGDLPPVAMITADGSSELKQRARALGYPLLHKPVRPAALRALLTALVRRQGEPASSAD